MITKTMRNLTAATLSLGLMSALTAMPAVAAPGDLFPVVKPNATQAADAPDAGFETARRGRGADNAPGDDRGGGKRRGRGTDDGPNHTSLDDDGHDLVIARRGKGADNAPGDDRGGGKRRGRGTDDAPNHG